MSSCAALDQLPAPGHRHGWPWTADNSRPAGSTCAVRRWPRVSVVTPSFNQGRFLEATLRSVLLQGYPDLEYIVVDGGSTDQSRAVLQRYAPYLAHWVSEPDRGQAHAINKGLASASGEILGWLNSDDLLTPGAVWRAVAALQAEPDVDLVYSDFIDLNERTGRARRRASWPVGFAALVERNVIPQPTAFYRRDLLARIGPVDERLHLALDWELWLRAARYGRVRYLHGACLAILRDYPDTKTRSRYAELAAEHLQVLDRLAADPALPPAARRRLRAGYANAAWETAHAAALRGQAYPEAGRWLMRSFKQHPRPALLRPLTTTRIALAALGGLLVARRSHRRACSGLT
jgi:GT2 family glycosyltransferase